MIFGQCDSSRLEIGGVKADETCIFRSVVARGPVFEQISTALQASFQTFLFFGAFTLLLSDYLLRHEDVDDRIDPNESFFSAFVR